MGPGMSCTCQLQAALRAAACSWPLLVRTPWEASVTADAPQAKAWEGENVTLSLCSFPKPDIIPSSSRAGGE